MHMLISGKGRLEHHSEIQREITRYSEIVIVRVLVRVIVRVTE